MNILLLSVGTRNKIIEYFKSAFAYEGNVIATDMTDLSPAAHDADRYYKVPAITAPEYIDTVLDICKKEEISAVLSLIDPELSLLAKNKDRFAEAGVMVIGSSYELCEMALDKMEMYNWLSEHGYRCAKSYTDKEAFYCDRAAGEIDFPVFVKPVRGSASVAISKVCDEQTLELLFEKSDNLMIQEFLDGQEIGADCYIDMLSGELVSVFTKKKLLMRAGETDKAVSFKDEKLFSLIKRFVLECGWRGQIDIDVFEVGGEYYISEVNPRFGGGYPHAYECGVDHMRFILNNMKGNANTPDIGHYEDGVYMMKYNEIKVIKF